MKFTLPGHILHASPLLIGAAMRIRAHPNLCRMTERDRRRASGLSRHLWARHRDAVLELVPLIVPDMSDIT